MNIENKLIKIGILGEDGSGKTTLLNAISFFKTQNEIEQDLFIFTDYPQEQDFRKALVTKSLEADSYVIVISADCNVKEKILKEQLQILKQLQIETFIIFYNKMDIASDEEVLLTEHMLKEILLECKIDYNKVSYIYGSAKRVLEKEEDFSCINVLMEILKEQVPKKVLDKEKNFYMSIEEVCWVKEKREKAIYGKIRNGIIRIKDRIEIIGISDSCIIGECTELIEAEKSVLKAEAGSKVKVFLDGINMEKVKKGQVLVTPYTLTPYTRFTALIYLLTREEGGVGKVLVRKDYVQYSQYFHNSEHSFGELWILPKGIHCYKPGEIAFIEGRFRTPKPIRKKDSIVLEENGQIIGKGFISQIFDKE